MFLILIVVRVTNKQWMVIMDKMDLLNFFVLGMEKLEDDKMMNPHCFFMLLSTVTNYIVLMWKNYTTISKLRNVLNTWYPYSINFGIRPTNLISCFITKKNPGNIFTLIYSKMNQNFVIFLKHITFWLVTKFDFLVCG